MRRLIDLTGKRFGRLTVIERWGTYYAPESAHSAPLWLCECDCGEEYIVRGDNLRSGATKSCGCLRDEHVSKARLERAKRERDG